MKVENNEQVGCKILVQIFFKSEVISKYNYSCLKVSQKRWLQKK